MHIHIHTYIYTYYIQFILTTLRYQFGARRSRNQAGGRRRRTLRNSAKEIIRIIILFEACNGGQPNLCLAFAVKHGKEEKKKVTVKP